MKSQIIFITGCSSGIGLEAAKTLTKRGHQVIASCRSLDDVKKIQNLGIEAIQMDVNQEQSITNGFKTLLSLTNGHLDVLINNAGYGQAGALEDVSSEALAAQFNTNVFGLMSLTRLAIPIMRQQGAGRIINMSSVLGFIGMPFRGAYNASKYAVEGLSDTLRLELKSAGIKVITIEPGPIESRFRERVIEYSLLLNIDQSYFKPQYKRMLSEYQNQKKPSAFTKKPDSVCHKLIHAIESKHPKPKYLVTFPTYLFMILKRVLSTKLLDALLYFLLKKELK